MIVLTSVGAPATPGVGIAILAMVLIMGIDCILDMSRTAINVSGGLVTAKLMEF